MNGIKLCPCNSNGCPEVKLEGETVFILDDFGDSIKMTLEEALLFNDVLEELISSQEKIKST